MTLGSFPVPGPAAHTTLPVLWPPGPLLLAEYPLHLGSFAVSSARSPALRHTPLCPSTPCPLWKSSCCPSEAVEESCLLWPEQSSRADLISPLPPLRPADVFIPSAGYCIVGLRTLGMLSLSRLVQAISHFTSHRGSHGQEWGGGRRP